MKIIHLPFCFAPDPIGGTEVYVERLSRALKHCGHESVIAVPGSAESVSRCQDLTVYRFKLSDEVCDIADLYGEGDLEASRSFGAVLDREKPDIVHLHAFTRGVSLLTAREGKKRNLPVIFTYHTPMASCQRGTLLRWGRKPCDGRLRLHTCSRCVLQGLGMNGIAAHIVGALPKNVGRMIGKLDLHGSAWTALRMTELMGLRHSAFRDLMKEVDQVVAVSHWVRDLLVTNGVPEEKITLSRQGVFFEAAANVSATGIRRPAKPLQVVFIGRLVPAKGADLLIKALRSTPTLDIRLHIFGVPQKDEDRLYANKVQELAGEDSRCIFHKEEVSPSNVIGILSEYHLLAVPSQWMETGPLVVLEAFAAGIPVMGSKLGGIEELVRHDVDGFLVNPFGSVDAWRDALMKIAETNGLYEKLRQQVPRPKRMEQVAEEMIGLYEKLKA